MILAPQRFDFAWDQRYRAAARPFGIGPTSASVELTDDQLVARYGRWTLRTPYANITAVAITGPYLLVKTAGPPRLGITDRGLTFASNGRRGVLITFGSPVRAIGPLRHPELTVTVADCEALAAALAARIDTAAAR